MIDCFNRRKLLLITSLLSGITLFVASILYFKEPASVDLGIIYALTFLLASYNAFDKPAFDASIVEYFQQNELISINSSMEIITSLCNVIGPACAGLLIILIGSKTLLIAAFAYAVSFILIKTSKPIRESSLNKQFKQIGELVYENIKLIKEGFAYLLKPGCPIALTVLITFLYNIFFSSHDTLIMFMARDKFSMTAKEFSSIVSIISLIVVFVLILLPRKLQKMDTFTIMIMALTLISFTVFCISLTNSGLILGLCYLMNTVTNSIYCIFARSLRLSIVPHSLTGRVASICSTLMYAGSGIGAIFSSFALEFITADYFFFFSGLAISLIAVLAFYLSKKFFLQTVKN